MVCRRAVTARAGGAARLGAQTARQSCPAATAEPLRTRLRPRAGSSAAWRRSPRQESAAAAGWGLGDALRVACLRAAAGVAAGTMPAAPPATPTRTAARPARGSPAPPSRGAWPGASAGAPGAPGVGDTPRRYSPSVENSTTRSSAVPICSLNRGNMRS
jgi:hypothetical protein